MSAPPAQVGHVMELTRNIDVPAKEAPAPIPANESLEAWLSAPSVVAESRDADHDTLRPSHRDLPPAFSADAFRRKPPWKALLAAAIVALAGVIWVAARSADSKSDTVTALQPGPRTVTPSRAPTTLPRAATKPRATSEAVASPVSGGDAPRPAESVKSAPSSSADTVVVTVRVSPPDAVVFKTDQRLGTGEVTVNVVRGTKTKLVAQLEGYLPRIFAVDGTYQSVNIVLKPAPSPKSQPDETTAARKGEPSEGASGSASKAYRDVPSGSTSASDSEPRKPSPPVSADTPDPM